MSNDNQKAEEILSAVKGKKLLREELCQKAIELAQWILISSQKSITKQERKQHELLKTLISERKAKYLIGELTDQAFRSSNPTRVAEHVRGRIRKWGIPEKLPLLNRLQLQAFQLFSKYAPSIAMPFFHKALQQQASKVIVFSDPSSLNRYLDERRREGIRINLNVLGEAILGEKEAQARLDAYLRYLQNPKIDYVSVKLTSICSQINLIAWHASVEILADRLRTLFRAAQANGNGKAKFINLDMEEYRDLYLTVEVFKKVLEEKEFHLLSAGIVLQSYLPDSYAILQELTQWAINRRKNSGAPIKIRIVKGANLSMERVDASLHEWPHAPFEHKWESDANFKRMVEYALQPEHVDAVRIGIGSHNIFDIAYAMLLRAENNLENEVIFEMLEGMAPHISRTVKEIAGSLLLYVPVVERKEFYAAVAYLTRRLEENTSSENFLYDLFNLTTENKEWIKQKEKFEFASRQIDKVAIAPRRSQNRMQENPWPLPIDGPFQNESDTDWSLAQNRQWLKDALVTWKNSSLEEIPLVIDGETKLTQAKGIGNDPSMPNQTLYHYQLASVGDVNQAVLAAQQANDKWSKTSIEERSHLLAQVAAELRKSRSKLIVAMMADAGKTPHEADVEISEAIDFCEYYRRNAEEMFLFDDIEWKPFGVAVVASPWNFPCSIPTGGIAAALLAGNAVLFKPPAETVLTGWLLAEAFWNAGIGKDTLQFITCKDEEGGAALIQHPEVNALILTGATATAQHLIRLNPNLPIFAETGGKNSIIVTELADKDMAVRDSVHSAFGHAGQKCSACSLLILLPEVFNDLHFKNQLKDAASSLYVGSAWDMQTRVPPLIRPAEGHLLNSLTSLEQGEEWLLEPKQSAQNPQLWSPGIKWNVKQTSPSYKYELFGPMLSVMKADNLKHAIELANGTPYGLTAGLQTLDDKEKRLWLDRIEAGNLYINRTVTGAIVARQPFGGCKQSSFGPGAKAGGPNYVAQLMQPQSIKLPDHTGHIPQSLQALERIVENLNLNEEQSNIWKQSLHSYAFFEQHYFDLSHHAEMVYGQDNYLVYHPRQNTVVRLQGDEETVDILRVIAAALLTRCLLQISLSKETFGKQPFYSMLQEHYPLLHFIVETDEILCKRAQDNQINLVRFITLPKEQLRLNLSKQGIVTLYAPVLSNGRIELLHYLREVAVSHDYHRYGNLGERGEHEDFFHTRDESAGICCGATSKCCGDGFCDEG